MATLAVSLREGDFVMADPAIFSLEQIDHRIFCGASFDAKKYIGMAKLTPIPDRMLFM